MQSTSLLFIGMLFGVLGTLFVASLFPNDSMLSLNSYRNTTASHVHNLVCHDNSNITSIGKGTMAALCELSPSFYEICSSARHITKLPGGNDKCLLPQEWNKTNNAMLYTPTGTLNRAHSGHFYEQLYPLFLTSLRQRSIALMEIGSFRGDSLRLWLNYFQSPSHFALLDLKIQSTNIAKVFRAFSKLNTSCKHTYSTHSMDQGNINSHFDALHHATAAVKSALPFKNDKENAVFDIIIDDGSHQCKHIRNSFETFFTKALRPGGIYVIEDLNVDYTSGCSSFFKDLLDFIHKRLFPPTSYTHNIMPLVPSHSIASIHCSFEMCIIIKAL